MYYNLGMSKMLNVRVADELADWVDVYAAERGTTKTQIVELALKELKALAAGGVPALPDAPRHRPPARPRKVRVCFRCQKCITRLFLEAVPALAPDCPDGHGPMVRDENRPYFGQEVSS